MSSPYIGQIILVGFNFPPVGWALCNGQLMAISDNEALFILIGTTYGGDGQQTFGLPDLRGRVPIHQGSNYVIGQFAGSENSSLLVTQLPTHTHPIDLSALTATARCVNVPSNQLSPVGGVPAVGPYLPFTDDPIVAGVTPIKAAHLIELRTRIDAVRSGLGLGAYPYTDSALTPGSVGIKAQHILDLRTALSQAYVQAGVTPPVFDASLTVDSPVKASQIQEVRAAVVNAQPGLGGTYGSGAPDASMNPATIVVGGTATAASVGGAQPHSNLQPYLTLNYCISLFGIFPSQS